MASDDFRMLEVEFTLVKDVAAALEALGSAAGGDASQRTRHLEQRLLRRLYEELVH